MIFPKVPGFFASSGVLFLEVSTSFGLGVTFFLDLTTDDEATP